MAAIPSYLDIDLSISPETIVALCVALAVNAVLIGVGVITVAHDRKIRLAKP